MKRIFQFLLYSFLFSQSILAQSFPSPDQKPVWYFNLIGMNAYESHATYSYGNDTLINDKTWHAVIYETPEITTLHAWVRIEGQKVLIRYPNNITIFPNREYVLYDFSLEKGDTISCPIFYYGDLSIPQPQNVLFTVSEVDTLEYDDVFRKTMTIDFSLADGLIKEKVIWIEGIGASNDPFYPFLCWGNEVCEIIATFCSLELNNEEIYSAIPYSCKTTNNTIVFVNNNLESGNNDGTSWQNAYQSLQTALQMVEYGSEIWVAEGTYFPTFHSTEREASFRIPTGIKLYGGFRGTEGKLSQRKPDEFPTILSGNIGVKEDSTDNSFHVIIMSDPDSNTVMDGFTIQDGHAVGSTINKEPFPGGGGLYIRITSEDLLANPIIKNCTFKHNVAQNGGAINITSRENYFNAPQIKNCTFINNRATTYGGAIFKGWGGTTKDTFLLSGNLFEENFALVGGGAIYFDNLINNLRIVECKFNNNNTRSGGGGLALFNHKNNASFNISDTEFNDNQITGDGGAIAFYNISRNSQYNYKFTLKNVICNNNRTNNSDGGALFFFLNESGNLELNIEGSYFNNNFSALGGGGIAVDAAPSSNTDISIKNSKFIKNQSLANVLGGIYYVGEGNSISTFNIINTLFTKNEGAFVLVSGNEGSNTTNIINSTFYQNGQQPIGKSWNPDNTNPNIQNKINLINTIIWEPQISEIGEILYNGDYNNLTLFDYSLKNCLLSVSTCDIPGSEICNKTNLFSKNPLFQDEVNGDFSLKPCSPAINMGIRDSLFEALFQEFDLGGNPRVLEDHPDIGSYEIKSMEPFEIEMVRLPSCFDSKDGEILFKTPIDIPFQINWRDKISSDNQIDSLDAGNYTFFLTTEDQCTDSLTYSMQAPDPIQFDYSIFPASGPEVSDGGIQINSVNGGSPPYRYELIQGDNIFSTNQLKPGIYELHVIDNRGCISREEVMISFISDINNIEDSPSIKIFPNPIQAGELNIHLTHPKLSKSRFSLKNIYGQDFGINGQLDKGSNVLNIDQLAPGIYLLEINTGQTKYIKRFIKN